MLLRRRQRWNKACGRIISKFVYVYPPGIPILMPGQVITREIVD
ncbi:hypothetical protein [Paenibacillus elgii]